MPRGLAEEVRAYVRSRIMAGQWCDGDRIVERDVAQQLGVSRGPIREAFRLLEEEGLVAILPRRGCRVSLPKADDAAEIFAIRASLEPVAARMLIERGGSEAILALEKAFEKLEASVRTGDWPQTIAADMNFHGQIFEHSGSWRLQRMWEGMSNSLVHVFRLHRPLYRSIGEVLPRHRAYLDVLKSGDVAEAERHAAEHVTEYRERFMQQIGAAPPPAQK